MFDRAQWILAGMSIALSLQLSQPAAAMPVGQVEQTAQTNSSGVAEAALNEGLKLYRQGTLESKKSAIAQFEIALKLFREAADSHGEAIALMGIGKVYSDLGEKLKAREYFSQSLPLFRAADDRSGEAVNLNNIGQVYSELGEKQKALEYFSQSLLLRRAVVDRHGEARTLSNIGQ
ncbi:MAG: tetratricopeptide repeat protein, partial [Richelia sp. CSU_2_1]|nr:tetratricopeptide repeat protein [Richelia sp. CSU_2_1]